MLLDNEKVLQLVKEAQNGSQEAKTQLRGKFASYQKRYKEVQR